jgi:hypothetical protein
VFFGFFGPACLGGVFRQIVPAGVVGWKICLFVLFVAVGEILGEDGEVLVSSSF